MGSAAEGLEQAGYFNHCQAAVHIWLSWQLPLLWLHGSARNLPIYCAAETCNDLIRLCESGSRRLVPEGACGGAWTKKPRCHKTCKGIILHVRSLCVAPSYSHLLAQPDLCFYFCLLSHQKMTCIQQPVEVNFLNVSGMARPHEGFGSFHISLICNFPGAAAVSDCYKGFLSMLLLPEIFAASLATQWPNSERLARPQATRFLHAEALAAGEKP